MLGLRLDGYEPDLYHDAAVAFCIHAREDELFSPLHQHRKGQLILVRSPVKLKMLCGWCLRNMLCGSLAKFHTATTLPWARNCVFYLLSRRLS